MVDVFSVGNNPLNVLGNDQTAGQRSQLAQYAILKASQDMKSNRQQDAIASFKQALAYDPQNITALTYIGNIHTSLGNKPEAIAAYKQLVSIDPTSSDSQILLGNAYLQDNQIVEAEKTFKLAARLDPRNPVPEFTLGMQYLQTDRLDDAETQFLKVQRMAPGDGNVHYGLGALYNKQGKFDEAVNQLRTALNLKPNFATATYELGVAYFNLGKQDLAVEQLQTLVNAKSALASDLAFVLKKPKILAVDASQGGFNMSLGSNTPVWMLDPVNLTAPGSSRTFSVNIQFDIQMDRTSVMTESNWSISRAKSMAAGYYNNNHLNSYTSGKDAKISSMPLSVVYNAYTNQATVTFSVSQNSTGDATIDPQHLVFKFSGMDAKGRPMDTSGDAIDGYATTSF